MEHPELSIVVVSCDSYKDIVNQYIKFFQTNWTDCKYPIYVAMEDLTIDNNSVISVKCGSESTWTERAIKAIKLAESQLILLSVDDLFISEKVDSESFCEIIEFIKQHNIKYYRIPVFKPSGKTKKLYLDSKNVEMIESNKRYNVSIGTAIWDRNELLRILGDGTMSAWDLENYFINRAEKAKPGYLDGYVSDSRLLLHSVHMIKSGKWIPSGVKEMQSKGNEIDLGDREFISFSDRLKLNKVYTWCSLHFPTNLRNLVKKIMRKMGFKFASN